MKKKILAIAIAAIMLVTAIASVSLAYMTDTADQVNVMTSGKVTIELKEWMRDENGALVEFVNPEFIYPAVIYDAEGKVAREDDGTFAWNSSVYAMDTSKEYTVAYEGYAMNDTFFLPDTNRMRNVIDKVVTVTNTGNNDAYIRTILLIETTASDVNGTDDVIMPNLEMNYDSSLTWQPYGYVEINGMYYYAIEFVYENIVAPNEVTLPSAIAFWVNPNIDNGDKFPENFEIYAYAQAVQVKGFNNAQQALDVAFGDVNAENLVDWTSDFVAGAPQN